MERLVSNPSKIEKPDLGSGMAVSLKRSGAGCHISLAGMPLATSPGKSPMDLDGRADGRAKRGRGAGGMKDGPRDSAQIRVWSSFVRLSRSLEWKVVVHKARASSGLAR